MKDILKNKLSIVVVSLALFTLTGFAQVENPTLTFNRGALWQSLVYGKVGPIFSNWGRKGIGLDWPGFDETWIRVNIGGAMSHLATGGFWAGAKKSPDSVLCVEDWSIYAGTVSADNGSKYIVTKHNHKYKNGENYWLKLNGKEGEEAIQTSWEYNMNYTNTDDREHQLPVRVTRTAHNWSGSKKDENYILYEYVIKNISPEIRAKEPLRNVADTLYDFILMFNYAMQVNSRSWSILFPSYTPGARNTFFIYDPTKKMIYGRATDYPLTYGQNEEGGFVSNQGMQLSNGQTSGEWTAPGLVGFRLLYSSPDNSGQSTRVNQYGWSAGMNSIDQSGPFNGIPGTNEAKYTVLKDIRTASSFVASPGDTVYMQRSRMWSLMSLGPWTILPGDSVVIAVAEIVNGVDYADALNKDLPKIALSNTSATAYTDSVHHRHRGGYLMYASADRAKFTYDEYRDPTTGKLTGKGFNHPDPPAAPKFTVDYYRGGKRLAANVLKWSADVENIPDPDDGSLDLAGYVIYRSGFLPIGPWDSIATIKRGDAKYFSTTENKYIYVDSSASVGSAYYYSITAYDTGKASWNIDPAAKFAETGNTNVVPAMESSIFSNRMVAPFTTTFPPPSTTSDIVVVPNPFVLGSSYAGIGGVPGSASQIQFVNVPNPCTIRIYTIRGDLVKTIRVEAGAGAIAGWDQTSDYGQFVSSGVYVFHVDSQYGTKIGKLAIVK